MQRVKGHPNVVSLLDVFGMTHTCALSTHRATACSLTPGSPTNTETSRHLYLVLEMCKGNTKHVHSRGG